VRAGVLVRALCRGASCWAGGLILVSAGCIAGPQADFTRVEAQRVEEAGRLKAVAFRADFEVRNMAGAQLLYEVRLLSSGRRPIRSVDGSFQTPEGTVAASRSLLVATSRQQFKDVAVFIPADQLTIRQDDLPVTALFTLSSIPREELARGRTVVPVTDAAELMPPLDSPPPDEQVLWFVRDTRRSRWPVLRGPYATFLDALEATPQAEQPPEARQLDEYAWFVPVLAPPVQQPPHYVGPCATEESARQVMETLAGRIERRGLQIEVGSPVRLRLKTGLDRRADPALWNADRKRRE